MSKSNPFRLVAHMLAAVFNSRTIFHREWEKYKEMVVKSDPIEGRWTGEWVSEKSGHRGELKCVLMPVPPGAYRAFFYARYSWLFGVGYVTRLEVKRTDSRILLTGEEDLGSLAGGIYRCEGEVSEDGFSCKYSCKYDYGIFRLKQVE